MAFIQVKVTNPTKRNRAYPWFPGGLMLTPGASKLVDFDPLSRIDHARGYTPLMKKDILEGVITLEYKIDPPCTVVGELTAPVLQKSAPKTQPTIEVHHDPKNDVMVKADSSTTDALTMDSPAEDFVSKTIMPPLVEEKPVDLSAFADMVSVAGAKKPAEVAVPTEPAPVDAPVGEAIEAETDGAAPEKAKSGRGKKKAKNKF